MLKMIRVLIILTVVTTFLVNFVLALLPPPQPMCSATACQVGNCPCITGHINIHPNESCCSGFNCVAKMSGGDTIDVHGSCNACAMKNEPCGHGAVDHRPCCNGLGLTCSEIINPPSDVISFRCTAK